MYCINNVLVKYKEFDIKRILKFLIMNFIRHGREINKAPNK